MLKSVLRKRLLESVENHYSVLKHTHGSGFSHHVFFLQVLLIQQSLFTEHLPEKFPVSLKQNTHTPLVIPPNPSGRDQLLLFT